MKKFNVAVVGATGLVGSKMIQVLEERKFPVEKLRLLASAKSAGTTIVFNGRSVDVDELTKESFKGIDIALFSAGGAISKDFAPHAVKAGALVIDNSSAWRMEPDVPLVVPEVNPKDIFKHKGIIANPNCSAIQLVVVLKPLHEKWRVKRVVVSTYQGVTGAGKKAVDQLEGELARKPNVEKKFPHPIAYNVLPQIDIFVDGGYTKEEIKMGNETKKIMGDDSIKVTATCVRVPVTGGHSESVNVKFGKQFKIEEVFDLLRKAPGITLQDDVAKSIYPMPIWSHEKDNVFVGRIRRDETIKNGLNLWIVSDNLRKGAATNAVQIAEEWLKQFSA
ncbi:MAG: aspartate-semialdehyde dehydrogenase [Bacteroidota bacterium]|nr:aspartate-semialdehyde dehydrogenase [Bacteroidota bacterium]